MVLDDAQVILVVITSKLEPWIPESEDGLGLILVTEEVLEGPALKLA